jgi:spore coat protein U-like protein
MKTNSSKIVKAIAAVFAITGAGFGVPTFATQTTGSFAVTATVDAACIVSGSALAFGSFNVLSGANVDSTSALSATCTNGSAYTVGLNAGTSTGATVSTRKMTHTNGTTLLNYSLSTLSSGGTNWDDVGGTTVAAGTGNGVAQSITVFGRVPTGQTLPIVGAYSDSITATIDF